MSQAIAEGDGISVLAPVSDAEAARAAESQGAEGVVVFGPVDGLREATSLPILLRADGDAAQAQQAQADACSLVVEGLEHDRDRLARLYAEAAELGLECVVEVRDDEELELVLEQLDPEIILLSSRGADDGEDELERVLDLLPDVPAGKLAIAELDVRGRDQVVALERAGIDAVIVSGDVAELVGGVSSGG